MDVGVEVKVRRGSVGKVVNGQGHSLSTKRSSSPNYFPFYLNARVL